jgi:hypothetical protein
MFSSALRDERKWTAHLFPLVCCLGSRALETEREKVVFRFRLQHVPRWQIYPALVPENRDAVELGRAALTLRVMD